MTQDFKRKLCDAGCTLHGTNRCGYDTRGIEQNCPYFNYILSGYELMQRELLEWLKDMIDYSSKERQGAYQNVIDKINTM